MRRPLPQTRSGSPVLRDDPQQRPLGARVEPEHAPTDEHEVLGLLTTARINRTCSPLIDMP